ncbi:ATP-NAD kinase-like domain-containing protein [Tanacetum coccineum]
MKSLQQCSLSSPRVLAIEGKKKTLQFHFNTSSKTGAVDFTMDDVLDEATDINGTIEPTKELTVSAASQSLESTKLEDAGKTMLTGRLKKLYVFLNPYGGKKSASKIFSNDVKPLLEDANIEFTMQESKYRFISVLILTDPNLRSRYVLYFHGSQLLESLDVKMDFFDLWKLGSPLDAVVEGLMMNMQNEGSIYTF